MKANFKSAVHMIIQDDNKILIQKRRNTKLWNGYYALPAGHIDEGENQYDALIREAKEELNIIINPTHGNINVIFDTKIGTIDIPLPPTFINSIINETNNNSVFLVFVSVNNLLLIEFLSILPAKGGF